MDLAACSIVSVALLGFVSALLKDFLVKKITSCSNGTRELGLTVMKPGADSAKKPPKSPREMLVPLHPPINEKHLSSSNSPDFSQPPPLQNSSEVSGNPWLNKRYSHHEIETQEGLERFLADVDENILESARKYATQTKNISILGSAPLRAVRMSAISSTPKKGDNELPPPMTMEESIKAFRHLGIYPEIEAWRDNLRQWFSSVVLNPLLNKINTSHERVMKTAAKLGIAVTISQVGNNTSIAFDEDGILNQLRATLIQALAHFQKTAQHSASVPILRDCIDAITEHQRLQSLVKGEWGKDLLPENFIRADYTVQRIRDLAKGTCVKNYEYLESRQVYDEENKQLTDSHLLLYLFCAFLEYPSWLLHVDPTSYGRFPENPLFLGVLPPKERCPEKYIAIKHGFPSVLHSGACVLAVGKQRPPVFALYWDKKAQFSLQGRASLWDSILLLCFKIRASYGELIGGVHLGSPVLGILSVFNSDMEE